MGKLKKFSKPIVAFLIGLSLLGVGYFNASLILMNWAGWILAIAILGFFWVSSGWDQRLNLINTNLDQELKDMVGSEPEEEMRQNFAQMATTSAMEEDKEQAVRKVKSFIQDGKFIDGLNEYSNFAKSSKNKELQKQIILFNMQYSTLQKDYRMKTINYNDYEVKMNRLSEALINLLD